ncbi:hypothetical protein HMPREF9080_00066 [Cardiobacterium valvarum F0432]|uniref:Uncharacterized protein n=1 Tax=Cardiobacterium valvarum F0432 TaxID=797473 RepID=G9ZBE3_9GAMM|nr:hypothetical protein HMPREF9080_00066 [Cardiobacterium valvarum F0432]
MVVAVAAVGVGGEQGGGFIAGVDEGQVAGIVTEGVVVAQAVEADVVKAAGSYAAEGVVALCRLQTGVVGGDGVGGYSAARGTGGEQAGGEGCGQDMAYVVLLVVWVKTA